MYEDQLVVEAFEYEGLSVFNLVLYVTDSIYGNRIPDAYSRKGRKDTKVPPL